MVHFPIHIEQIFSSKHQFFIILVLLVKLMRIGFVHMQSDDNGCDVQSLFFSCLFIMAIDKIISGITKSKHKAFFNSALSVESCIKIIESGYFSLLCKNVIGCSKRFQLSATERNAVIKTYGRTIGA